MVAHAYCKSVGTMATFQSQRNGNRRLMLIESILAFSLLLSGTSAAGLFGSLGASHRQLLQALDDDGLQETYSAASMPRIKAPPPAQGDVSEPEPLDEGVDVSPPNENKSESKDSENMPSSKPPAANENNSESQDSENMPSPAAPAPNGNKSESKDSENTPSPAAPAANENKSEAADSEAVAGSAASAGLGAGSGSKASQGAADTSADSSQAGSSPSSSTLSQLLRATAVGRQLAEAGTGPFTVFAPTDSAVEAFLQSTNLTLADLEAAPGLDNLLRGHVAPGRFDTSALTNAMQVCTLLADNCLRVNKNATTGEIRVGDAKLVRSNVAATNGMVHLIDRVLVTDDMQIMQPADSAPASMPAMQTQSPTAAAFDLARFMDAFTSSPSSGDGATTESSTESSSPSTNSTSQPASAPPFDFNLPSFNASNLTFFNASNMPTFPMFNASNLPLFNASSFPALPPFDRATNVSMSDIVLSPPIDATQALDGGATSAPEMNMTAGSNDTITSPELGNLMTIMRQSASMQTMKELFEKAQLSSILDFSSSDREFTVLVPTNEAFSALGMGPQTLLDLPNLQNILLYHVIPRRVDSAQLANETSEVCTLLAGACLKAAVSEETGKVLIDGEAGVTEVDIPANNGLIHVIDRVLMPPEGAASSSQVVEVDTTSGEGGAVANLVNEVVSNFGAIGTDQFEGFFGGEFVTGLS